MENGENELVKLGQGVSVYTVIHSFQISEGAKITMEGNRKIEGRREKMMIFCKIDFTWKVVILREKIFLERNNYNSFLFKNH